MSPKILIVEDEMIVANDLKYTLEKMDYRVTGIVDSGAKALEAVQNDGPDLVMMDIRIRGDFDGIETADRMRQNHSIPIVFLTAYADEVTLDRAKRIQPFGYLIKPFQERDVRTTIEIALYKHDMERQLEEQRQWFHTTLRSIDDAVVATDTDGRITFMNTAAERLTQWGESDARGKHLQVVMPVTDSDDARPISGYLETILRDGKVIRMSDTSVLLTRNGERRPISDSGAPIALGHGEILGSVFVFQDVTEKRRLEQERERLIESLQKALAEVKTLRELIPICSVCKKVRNDEGFWKEVEEYISEQTDAQFTHGICPECLRRIYPELSDEMLEEE